MVAAHQPSWLAAVGQAVREGKEPGDMQRIVVRVTPWGSAFLASLKSVV